jgi:hypothetical protein
VVVDERTVDHEVREFDGLPGGTGDGAIGARRRAGVGGDPRHQRVLDQVLSGGRGRGRTGAERHGQRGKGGR